MLDHVIFALGNALIAAAVALLGELRSAPARFSTRVRNWLVRFGVAMMGLTGIGMGVAAANVLGIKLGGIIVPWWAMKSLTAVAGGVLISGAIGFAAMSAGLLIPAAAEPRVEPAQAPARRALPEESRSAEAVTDMESEYRKRLRRSV